MSSTYTTSPDSNNVGSHNDPFYMPTTPLEATFLSPFNHSHTLSNSASPSYNLESTPGESVSDYSDFPSSEYTIDDEFFGVNFDANLQENLPSAFLTLETDLPPSVTHLQSDPPLFSAADPATTTLTSRYPISPIQSATPSTPSPRTQANDKRAQTRISQHELITSLQKARAQKFPSTPIDPTTLQLTPDHSGSSQASGEGKAPSKMAYPGGSPQVTVSQWGESQLGDAGLDMLNNDFTSNQSASGYPSQNSNLRDSDGSWLRNNTTGQAGLDPERRKMMRQAEIPTLREQEEQRDIQQKNIQVTDWVSHTAPEHFAPVPGSSYPNQYAPSDTDSVRGLNFEDETRDIKPVDDAASIRENKPRDGDVFYNLKTEGFPTGLSDDDLSLIVGRHWNETPAVPRITSTKVQPPTANAAIMKFTENADRFSVISRRATWGTRRLSDSDIESVVDGSFLKKMSINDRELERKPSNIFARMMPKKSSSNLKRSHSTSKDFQESSAAPMGHRKESSGSLAPPPRNNSFGRSQTQLPSINTAFAAMAGPLAAVGTTHARSGSVSAVGSGPVSATSPKSPGNLTGFARNVIKRARSRSDLPRHGGSDQSEPGLAGLWRGAGGPPVPNTSFHVTSAPRPVEELDVKPVADLLDQDDDDDDDDEEADEMDYRMKTTENTDPIDPTNEGFKAHIRRLNPTMAPQYSWLISRIAHQQEIRYKNLLTARVKHLQAVHKGGCSSGQHCLTVGGKATLYDVKGKVREQSASLSLMTDIDDDDPSLGDATLTADSFPVGVPIPPTRSLPAEFECQLCFKSKKFQKPSDWTKHVHEDVQPFTCTYEKCKEPKSFKRKADWVRHENERHRHLEWWVCQVEDCKHPCYRKDNFLQHLVREHKLPEPKQKTKTAIKKARQVEPAWLMLDKCHHETTNRPQDEPCKFCGKTFNTWKKLTVHLAKHMEYISLPVLKLVEEKRVEADTIISPVENVPTPITPLPKLETGGSPFNFSNVSPRPPMQQQYTGGYQQPTFYTPNGSLGVQTPIPPQIPPQMAYNPTPAYNNAGMYRMEQSRGFDPLNTTFTTLPEQTFINPPRQHQYSMSQGYIARTPVQSDFQNGNMLGINTTGFGFDGMSLSTDAAFQQAPLPHRGSSSPYDQPLQTNQYFPQ
ncbi:hypothetical protein BP6252_09121 [Coleophoma cylindrospora]|uniref:C2H2-type domain-containing protein n=1 Tax=Coleophoma cylindrospora TaxID=1849047 RepID=A0A3D8R126_9HELO|nr:hypothetical protein BP6252_09121 [Coleophoma cylindrospora]